METLRDRDLRYLRAANIVSRRARDRGNHPFGAVLVDAAGAIVLEAENSYTTDRGPGHAEANLAREAARRFPADYLLGCVLYSPLEPCCMCTGSLYWAGIGGLVYGVGERRLLELTGNHVENPTMDLSCRTVLAAGQRPVEVRGPYPEIEAETLAVHAGFWR